MKSLLPGEARLYKWTYGQIYYQVAGPKNAPLFVLVHAPGIGASSHEMHGIMDDLAQSYRVYALDLLGFGLSDHPSINYTADMYVSLLHDFLVSVVGQPATLLASGLSCQYCAAVAATNPTLCDGLVFLSPLSLSAQDWRQNFLMVIAGLPFFGLALYSLLTIRFLWPAPLTDDQQARSDNLAYRFAVAHQLNAHRAVLAHLAGKLAIADSATRSTRVTQPILELWGTRTLREAQVHALQEFASSHTQVVLVRDVGPCMLEEQPQVVVRHILTWKQQETRETGATGEISRTEGEDEGDNVTETVEAYCVKCRQKRMMQNPKPTVTKNGRNALEGNCPVCGTRLFRFVGNQ